MPQGGSLGVMGFPGASSCLVSVSCQPQRPRVRDLEFAHLPRLGQARLQLGARLT